MTRERSHAPRARAALRALPALATLALLAALTALAGCSGGGGDDAPARKPHIILVSIDTLRPDHLGCYGYERDTSPYLDSLAAQSTLFERAYTTLSFTLVAHMSMHTGLYPAQHGVWKQDQKLPGAVPLLAEQLQAAGYHTVGLYDSRWLDPHFGFDRGFDVYEPHAGAPVAGMHLETALRRRPADEPLFVFLHLMDVHNKPVDRPGATLYEPPEPYDSLFVPDAKARLADAPVATYWKDASAITPEEQEAVVALYDGGIRYVDTWLERWFGRLAENGILDDAVLLITSDHGEGLNQRGDSFFAHGKWFEEGLRVPLILRRPDGAEGGRRVDTPVSLVDVVPTLLDAAGLEVDTDLPGASLLGTPPKDRVIHAESPTRFEVAVRYPWKLVETRRETYLADLDSAEAESEPHFDGGADADAQQRLDALRGRAEADRAAWSRPLQGAAEAGALSPEAVAELKALGDLGDEDG